MTSDLSVGVVELRRHLATRQELQRTVHLDDLRVVDASIPESEPVIVHVVVESVPDGVMVEGEITSRWSSPCRRCLEPVVGDIRCSVRELFSSDPESYPLGAAVLDLEPMVRDALLLSLPLAPACEKAECAEVASPEAEDTDIELDPRWAALDDLNFS